MLSTGAPPTFLDLPTLAFVSIALAGLLGLFLLLCWMQERDVRPLAWWGSAYLIGAASMALWQIPVFCLPLPREIPEAMTLLACGVVWSGVRLFHGRELRPLAAGAGASAWPVFCAMPGVSEGGNARVTLAALLVAAYTFLIACELRRERRKSRASRARRYRAVPARSDLPPAAADATRHPGGDCAAMGDGVRARDHHLCGRHGVHRSATGQGPSPVRLPPRSDHRSPDRAAEPPRLPARRKRIVRASGAQA